MMFTGRLMHISQPEKVDKNRVLINVKKDEYPFTNISSATVTLKRNSEIFIAKTNEQGNAVIEGETGGRYMLDIEKYGYKSLHIDNWTLRDGEHRLIDSLENVIQMNGYDILTMDGDCITIIK